MNAAFLFPGQGAQTVGMGTTLCAESPQASQIFAAASDILGYDLLDICGNGPAEKLNATEFCQPALLVSSLAALEKLKLDDPACVESCRVAAGLSLGEYSALVFAGAISFADGVRLVQQRGQAMQRAADATRSSMVSVIGLDEDRLRQIRDDARGEDVLELANFLCPGNTVLSGTAAACERAAALANDAGAMKVVPLAVAGAFHTSIMEPAREQLAAALEATTFSVPRVPVVSNVDACAHDDPAEIRALLQQQLVQPVQWERSMRYLIDDANIDHCYEIGTGKVLRGLLKRIQRKFPCDNVPA